MCAFDQETARYPHVRGFVIHGHRGSRIRPHVSYLSLLRLPTASFTSTFSAARPSPFLIGNDRGSVLKFPTSDSTITRHLAKKSRAGAGRVRPDGENGPRCNLKPLPSNRPILYFLILVVSPALSRDLMTGSTGYRVGPCWVQWNFGRVPPGCTGMIFAASCAWVRF